MDTRIVRIFNTFGPRSDPMDGRLVPNFITQALRGEPLTVYGDGQQTRSLCFVDDLVEGLVRMMECASTSGHVVNLGNPEEHRVVEFAQMIGDLVATRPGIVFTPPAVGDDPQRRQPDITKARRLIGWEPKVALGPGLQRTVDYFRDELSLPRVSPAV